MINESRRYFVRGGALIICLLILAGTATTAQRRPGKQDPPEKKDQAVPETATGGGPVVAAPVDPKTFKIGPEDVLAIDVWKEPDLSGLVQVRPDGRISPRLIPEVEVAGLTPDQLSEKLRAEFGKLVLNPIVQVVVREVRSRKYYINGNVSKTGAFPLVVPITVLEALTIAGGLNEWADKKNIIIMRGDKRLKFNYKDVIKGKNMSQNIFLENGDFVIVE
jgi:polysaccharide export outer membrane protein